ncbi:MAG: endonuclease/exonuclease/phosphatase family protein [archaeon]
MKRLKWYHKVAITSFMALGLSACNSYVAKIGVIPSPSGLETVIEDNYRLETNELEEKIEIQKPSKEYTIGSFNIQVFGKSKASKENVINVITDIITDYDILAIQEVRDNSGTVIEYLESIPNFDISYSERLGRSSSKEQYVFFYSENIISGETKQYPDVNDVFEREPFAQKFTIQDYDFVLVQIHVKPTDAENEINALPDVVEWIFKEFNDKDIYITGDLNADCNYFSSFSALPDYEWLIDETIDTTTKGTDCAYDRFIAVTPSSYIVRVGVDNLQDEVGNDQELLEDVSDHYPIYMILDINQN